MDSLCYTEKNGSFLCHPEISWQMFQFWKYGKEEIRKLPFKDQSGTGKIPRQAGRIPCRQSHRNTKEITQ